MTERYWATAERIGQELAALQRVVQRVRRAMALAYERPDDQDFYLDSVALNLHDVYTGLERIFHRIASTIDGTVPSGDQWHQELLNQMAQEVPDIRPAVISDETRYSLDEYLRFRHVVRNIYAYEFEPERLGHLVARLDATFQRIHGELSAFSEFLHSLTQADESS